jgi:hypothetical protein
LGQDKTYPVIMSDELSPEKWEAAEFIEQT